MKTFLGTLEINTARAFVQVHTCAWLGSKTLDCRQRVFTAEDGEDLRIMQEAFIQIEGSKPAALVVSHTPPSIQAEEPDPNACVHRGSQRMAACCGGGRLNQWICRKIKQENGKSVDCVRTLAELRRNRASAGNENSAEFDKSIVACEGCADYTPRQLERKHDEIAEAHIAALADNSVAGPVDSLAES